MSIFSLHGKTALVTGAASGIGQAIAIGLAEAGADVAITVNQRSATQTHHAITALGRRCLELRCDLSQPQQIQPMLEQLQQNFSALDILVNNAGLIRRADAFETTLADWNAVLEVNLTAVWQVSQQAATLMQPQGGKIINIASLLSFQGGVRVPAYTASKHAVQGLTKALANEWAALGINVNAIAPGYIRTSNTEALQNDPKRNQQILERIPAGRWGESQDLVGATVFLASSAANYIHGHTLVVDGGWLAR